MRDEDDGQVALADHAHEEFEDLRLDRDVERGQRLVEYQQIRLDGDRACDGDALTLAAGEFVRIAVAGAGEEADLLEQAVGARDASVPVEVLPVQQQALHDAGAHRGARVQAAIGILEDDLHVRLEGEALAAREGGDVAALEAVGAAVMAGQAGDDIGDGRLAAAGFAEDADHLAAIDGDVDVAERRSWDSCTKRRRAKLLATPSSSTIGVAPVMRPLPARGCRR